MDGLRVVTDEEKIGGVTAAGSVKRFGRASMSFSLQEALWLYEALLAVQTKNQHRAKELANDPVGQTVLQKAQRLKYSAEGAVVPVP